jgi:hypothetical protein
MPDTQTPFEDLPILTELRDDLSRAYTAREAPAITPRRRGDQRGRRSRLLNRFGASRRPVAFAGAGAAFAAAAAVAVFLLASPATQPAYALTQNSDGSVTVTIHDVETAVPALNARFKAMGIDETVVPVEANCRSKAAPPLFVDPKATTDQTLTFYRGHKYLAPGDHGVLAAEQLPNGQVAYAIAALTPPIPSCFPTTAYNLQKTGTTTNGAPIIHATPVNPTATTTTGN